MLDCLEFPKDAASALGVLALGNPRELIRIADISIGSLDYTTLTVDQVVYSAIMPEVQELRDEIVGWRHGNDRSLLTDTERTGAYNALSFDSDGRSADLLSLSPDALAARWDPTWLKKVVTRCSRRIWRRLLVRLYVAGRLIGASSDPSPTLFTSLMCATVLNARSAIAARSILDGLAEAL